MAWIITPAERTAFVQLSTDDERDRFIEQFWERRNPGPGSTVNSYKEEHYKRIAYSNEHFAANKPGWSTDRGHIYIAYGKPESIDSHPSRGEYQRPAAEGGGTVSTYPFEVWHYASAPAGAGRVDFEFVGSCGCGDFRLSAEPERKVIGAVAHAVSYERPSAPAQADSSAAQGGGAIAGTISDPVGAVVARAKVTLTNTETGVALNVATDELGRYSFAGLAAGRYNVVAVAVGFKRQLQTNVVLTPRQTVALDLKLSVDATQETVTVRDTQGAQVNAAVPSGPMRVSGGVMAGNVVSKPDPVYPAEAKAAHVQGAVVLHAVVSKTGTVENLTVVSGPEGLRASALDAVRRWTYRPYLLNGQPVEVETTVTVNYTFGGESASSVPGQSATGQAASGAAASGRPQRVSSGVMAGAIISRVDPVYPPDAKAAGVQGAVVLRAVIAKTGLVENLVVVSGPQELAGSALDAVKQWVYKPYLLNGEPTEVETTITVNYALGGGGNAQAQPPSDDPRVTAYPGFTDAELYKTASDFEQQGLQPQALFAVKRLIERYPASPYQPKALALRDAVVAQMDAARKQRAQQEKDDAAAGIKEIGPGVSHPTVLKSIEPEFSAQARKDKVSGNVLLTVLVDERGTPHEVKVIRALGHGLDEKAIAAVKQYKFKPAMDGGVPVKVRLNIEVNFQIF